MGLRYFHRHRLTSNTDTREVIRLGSGLVLPLALHYTRFTWAHRDC